MHTVKCDYSLIFMGGVLCAQYPVTQLTSTVEGNSSADTLASQDEHVKEALIEVAVQQ